MIRLADLIKEFQPDLEACYGSQLLPGHKNALSSILRCRTEDSGSVSIHCHDCDEHDHFHLSCGHRFCPQCQHAAGEQWIERQRAKLLPVDYFLITITGINKREEAAIHTGAEVSIPETGLPEPQEGEYYYKDLEGLAVVTDDGRNLGTITSVFSAGGGNDVFEVRGPLGEVLIPVTEETILEVNIEDKFVKVHLLEGLLPDNE